MIKFLGYTDNEDAPAVFVNGVGGIYKIGASTIQVVFVRQLRNAEGEVETTAVASLIWDEKDWLDGGKLFKFAMAEYVAGTLGDGHQKERH